MPRQFVLGSSFPEALRSPKTMASGWGAVGTAASAVGGIQRAQALHERAAGDVSRAFHPELGSSQPAATVSISNESRDLAVAFVDMMKAESMQAANVTVLRTADEMTGELLDLKK